MTEILRRDWDWLGVLDAVVDGLGGGRFLVHCGARSGENGER